MGGLALQEYNRTFGRTDASIPVDSIFTGGAEGHWRESVFDNELMTPFAEFAPTPMPYSRMTAASLADLGYQVNMSSPFIDPFTPPAGATGFLTAGPGSGAMQSQLAGHPADPEAMERVREIFRANRPTVSGPAILVEAIQFEFAHSTPHGQAAALPVLDAPQESEPQEVVDEAPQELFVSANTVAPSLPEAAARKARVADIVFAEGEAFVEHARAFLDEADDGFGVGLPVSLEELVAVSLME
jgi:hypothetical protein